MNTYWIECYAENGRDRYALVYGDEDHAVAIATASDGPETACTVVDNLDEAQAQALLAAARNGTLDPSMGT